MKKLLLSAILLASSVWASAQTDRVTRLQAARNLIVTTTDGQTTYHSTTTAQSLILRKQGNTLTVEGRTIDMGDIRKMRLVVPQKFQLNEDSATFTPMSIDHGLMALRYSFQLNKWNPLVVPLTLTGEQVLEAFGEGTQLAVYKQTSEGEWAQVDFELVDLNTTDEVIVPGEYFIIRPTRQPDIATGRKTTVSYGGSTVSGPAYIIYNVSMDDSRDAPLNKSLRSAENNVSMRVSGTYKLMSGRQKLMYSNRAFYCMNDDGRFYEPSDSVEMKAFRNWVVFVKNANNLPMRFYVGGIDEDLTLTGINSLLARDGKEGDDMVYDLSGRRLGSRKSLDGLLPRGLYIMNGKKILVR